MENENEQQEVVETSEDTVEVKEEVDTTDWKSKFLEADGKAKRYKSKLEKAKTEAPETETKKTGDIDYGHLAFFNSTSDVKLTEKEDRDYLKSMIEETGKSQETLLNSSWFKNDIKERQEKRIVTEAIPDKTGRSAPSAKTTADYWLDKPFDDVPKEMKREVLSARMKREEQNSKFSDQPVISQ